MGYYSEKVLATSGLVGYWKLDETSGTVAADSKSTNNGTIGTGVTLGQSGPLNIGGAMLFDGSTNFVSITSAPALHPTSAVTMEFWFYATDSTNLGTSPELVNNTQAGQDTYRVTVSGSLIVIAYSNASTQTNSFSNALTTWYHIVAGVSASNSGHVYRNGVEGTYSIAVPATNPLIANAGPFEIGGSTFDRRFKGRLCHVALYNTLLSSATALDHYNTALADPGHPASLRPTLQAVNRAASW